MSRLILILGAVLIALPAHAMSAQERQRLNRQMLELTPDARAEERCDARANGIVQREHKGFRPDKTVAYAFDEVTVRGQKVKAPGAAIRSKGDWYRLSYDCRTTANGLNIEAFRYKLGEKIPHSQWSEHGLYP